MSRKRIGLGLVVLAALAMAPACGGGSGDDPGDPTPGPLPNLALAFSIGSLDGWVSSNSQYSAAGTSAPWAGDLDATTPGVMTSAFYSFDISVLPPGAVIDDATLSVDVVSSGGDPYGKYGNLHAYYAPYGGDLANVLTLIVVGAPSGAPFSPATATAGVKQANVLDLLRHAFSEGDSMFQVQVAFGVPSNSDGVSEWVNLTDAENLQNAGAAPTLSFTWRAP